MKLSEAIQIMIDEDHVEFRRDGNWMYWKAGQDRSAETVCAACLLGALALRFDQGLINKEIAQFNEVYSDDIMEVLQSASIDVDEETFWRVSSWFEMGAEPERIIELLQDEERLS